MADGLWCSTNAGALSANDYMSTGSTYSSSVYPVESATISEYSYPSSTETNSRQQSRRAPGGKGGGMASTAFYNWLMEMYNNRDNEGRGAYMSYDGQYYYYDLEVLRAMWEEYMREHPDMPSMTFDEWLEQWFNIQDDTHNRWFRAPICDAYWFLLLLILGYAMCRDACECVSQKKCVETHVNASPQINN